jgi:alpha-ribazole phosphatase
LALEIQALEPDFIITFDDRLREINFGQWEGQLWDDVPRHELDTWANHFAHHRLGHTGECVQAWAHRVWAAAREDLTHGDDTLWITHAGVMRAAQVWLQAGCPTHLPVGHARAWPAHAPPPGCGVIWTRHGQCAPWELA